MWYKYETEPTIYKIETKKILFFLTFGPPGISIYKYIINTIDRHQLNMNISNNNHRLNILDLPDEILLNIFNKLNLVDVFYSLVDVNQRFDRLVFDPLYIRNPDLTSMTMKSCFDRTFSIDNHIPHRLC
jgi:hypothetical protein